MKINRPYLLLTTTFHCGISVMHLRDDSYFYSTDCILHCRFTKPALRSSWQFLLRKLNLGEKVPGLN